LWGGILNKKGNNMWYLWLAIALIIGYLIYSLWAAGKALEELDNRGIE